MNQNHHQMRNVECAFKRTSRPASSEWRVRAGVASVVTRGSGFRLARCLAVLVLVGGGGEIQASLRGEKPRIVRSLDGTWEIDQGSWDQPPAQFRHTVRVPGLVDLADPAFAEVGRKSSQREAFWYRRTFPVEGRVPGVALLKLHKARYGSQVRLNGGTVGDHLPCFTPGYFDLRPVLRGEGAVNELIIRVGADRESLPKGMPTGWDFEKYLYLPGLYDSVELILTEAPYVANVQAVPDIDRKVVQVMVEVAAASAPCEAAVSAVVQEAKSHRRTGSAVPRAVSLAPGERKTVELEIPIERCRLWSPEDPFLYELTVGTGADAAKVRFGMRSFRFDAVSGRALLNGKPYFLRGSNVTAYRFFEDAERADRPWREDWVRRLHRRVKDMHWNALRYCIGFPPELWYEIADEEGILIQDEFPIWTLGEDPEKLEASKIVPEYTEWMRERWNHPSVVIWDAQNESHTAATGQALQAVRHLDLSDRPWDNGWAEPQAPTDCAEAHPYRFIRDWNTTNRFRMSEFATMSGVPELQAAQRKLRVPILINEYAWLWLDRRGDPTCLTDKVYEHLLGPGSTGEQRRHLFARLLAAKTEFWRSKRACAGVLHFCTLGYSRPGDKPRPEGGATSDHWIDMERLKFEPNFERYVKDAFNPVGVMLDFWAEEAPAGSTHAVKVIVINDLEPAWRGEVHLEVWQGSRRRARHTAKCEVASFGRTVIPFRLSLPMQAGDCTLVGELSGKGARQVRSLRALRLLSQ